VQGPNGGRDGARPEGGAREIVSNAVSISYVPGTVITTFHG
jgi:hypothetical protein